MCFYVVFGGLNVVCVCVLCVDEGKERDPSPLDRIPIESEQAPRARSFSRGNYIHQLRCPGTSACISNHFVSGVHSLYLYVSSRLTISWMRVSLAQVGSSETESARGQDSAALTPSAGVAGAKGEAARFCLRV